MWKDIFQTGNHTSAEGSEKVWTTDDLDKIVERYNNQATDSRHEAPIVLGHPDTDDPAYGWVESLKRTGNKLLAKFKDVDDDLRELVQKNKYRYISIALYPDMLLRHVGVLGAAPPAVKGLTPVKFSAAEFSEYEYAEPERFDATADKATDLIKEMDLRIKTGRHIQFSSGSDNYNRVTKDIKAITDAAINGEYDAVNMIKNSMSVITRAFSENAINDAEAQEIVNRFSNVARDFESWKEIATFFDETPPALKSAQARASLYGVTFRPEYLRKDASLYFEYDDQDFADPVHRRFPLRKLHETRASLAVWSRKDIRGQYSEAERQIIAARLISSAQKYNVSLTPMKWLYSDVQIPVEALTRQQLIDFVKKVVSIDNNKITTTITEGNHMEMLKKFIEELLAKVSEQVGEDVATVISGIAEEIMPNYETPAEETPAEDGTATPPPAAPPAFSEKDNKEIQLLKTQLAVLQKENQDHKYNAYFDETVDRGITVPAQRNLVLNALNLGSAIKEFTFADGDGRKSKTAGEVLIKQLIESFPKRELTKSLPDGDGVPGSIKFAMPNGAGYTIDDDTYELYTRVQEFAEANKCSFEVALSEINR